MDEKKNSSTAEENDAALVMEFEEGSVEIAPKILLHAESAENSVIKNADDSVEMIGDNKIANRLSNSQRMENTLKITTRDVT